jgi:hypothetical protein
MDPFAVIFVVFIGLVIPFGLLAIGLVCYIRLRRSVFFRNVLSSFVMLLIGVPIGAFITAVIPTFIGSLFLPPGYAEWIMYGIVAVVTPILLLGWWHRVKLLFSKDYRGVVISNPERMRFYQSLPELPVSRGDTKIIKTRQARKGTTSAKLRSAVGHVAFPSLLIAILALRKIPLLGILFSPLTAGAMGKFGLKLDNLREEVKRLEAPTLAEVLEADSRKPVLLLRSFLDDQFEVQSLDSENKNTDSVTFEELICRTASGWGPVVAIGEPGEEMPHLGAARAYFTNETWQGHALDLLERSRVVLMVMGKTPSVGWELARIFERKYFSKTIVIFPPCDEISLAQRLLVFQKVFQEMTGNSFELRIAPDHVPLAVTFDGEGQYLVISGPFADSPVYQDVLLLGSRVIHANAVNGAES